VNDSVSTAKVLLWGTQVGAVTWVEEESLGYFQFDPVFLSSRIELSPLTMPLAPSPYAFRALPWPAFKGLPGLLADVLPDKFGNRLIDAWLAEKGLAPESFSPVERLCYVGSRGMGALEFEPMIDRQSNHSKKIELSRLVQLANQALDERTQLSGKLQGDNDQESLEEILQVGTSAGGARAKAVLAWNPESGEFRSGQLDASLAALQHFDFNDPLGYSYEQAILTIRQLELGPDALEEQFRRTVFNLLARNQDDHVKNIAFLMDRSGNWSLSPAYDVTYAYNPSGDWTQKHQMSVNGKRDEFTTRDLLTFGATASLKTAKAKAILEEVKQAIERWMRFAEECGVDGTHARAISKTHRIKLPSK